MKPVWSLVLVILHNFPVDLTNELLLFSRSCQEVNIKS